MGDVKLKPARVLNRDIAILFGGEATRPTALKVEAKAKALADVKAKHSSWPTASISARTRTAPTPPCS